MEKKHFLLKSTACRPTFQMDMTDAERAVMHQHIAYWKEKTEKGISIIFGAVMDTSDVWGLGIVEVENENEIQPLIDADPAYLDHLMTYQYFPMRVGMIRG